MENYGFWDIFGACAVLGITGLIVVACIVRAGKGVEDLGEGN